MRQAKSKREEEENSAGGGGQCCWFFGGSLFIYFAMSSTALCKGSTLWTVNVRSNNRDFTDMDFMLRDVKVRLEAQIMIIKKQIKQLNSENIPFA